MEEIHVKSDCANDEIISIQECKGYLKKYKLSEERILNIKDSLIGMVDGILNTYLEDFKSDGE